MFTPVNYTWQWHLDSSPEILWPLVSDTNRFNRDTRLPPVEYVPHAEPPPSRRLRFRMLGVWLEWVEEPFEWLQPYRFAVQRVYVGGPMAEIRVRADLSPEGRGTLLTYDVWAQPRNLLGALVAPLQIRMFNGRQFNRVFRQYDAWLVNHQLPPDQDVHPRLAPGGRARLQELRGSLESQNVHSEGLDRLLKLVQRADDLTLSKMRPYTLADHWGLPRRPMLELFLYATRAGLLDMRWELLCPNCRGASATAASLGDIETHQHCDTCNIDFAINFEHSVELTFQPNPAVRPIRERLQFCVAGPQQTPHIILQQIVAPGEQRRVSLHLETGRYRLRAMKLQGATHLLAAPDGAQELSLPVGEYWPSAEYTIATQPTLVLENDTAEPQVLVLERTAWSDQAATANDVTTLQSFRDLFSREALRPGNQISVGSLTLLFTDLSDSTRMYRQIGDAPAFGRVMGHFDALEQAIAEESGAIVKTIGDAVMAVFKDPPAALRAAEKIQRGIGVSNYSPALQIKIGIHTGPCIAVTLNERLDYFGSTVNIASRLLHLAQGGEIVISTDTAADPDIAAWLSEAGCVFRSIPFQAQIKGFVEPFNSLRLTLID